MRKTLVNFVERFVERFSFLAPLMREHLVDNLGEMLPHVFFGELTRYVVDDFCRVDSASAAGARPARQVQELIGALEEAFAAGPEEIRELIAVSFLENLPRPGEDGEGLRDVLGPRLRSELGRLG